MFLRMMRSMLILVVAVLFSLAWIRTSEAAFAVTTTVLQPNLTGTNLAILRQPEANPNSHIGIFIMHPDAGYATFSGCTGLAQRGFTTLCADTVFNNRAFDFKGYEDHVPAIIAGINYLRTQVPGITKVLIFGHSMGAPMMAYYENVAEHGAAVCTGPEKIIACDTTNLTNSNGTNKLVPVDGIILFDAHLGDALATFTYVDPAIRNDNKPTNRTPSLDMFAAANGYPGDAAAGSPTFKSATYSDKFKDRFFKEQAGRNGDLLQEALSIWADIQAGTDGVYSDDMPFSVPGSNTAARLWQADLSLVKCTQQPHIFITHTGIQNPSPGPICSVRIPSSNFANANTFNGSDINASVHIWLGAHALRTNGLYSQTENDITGIDYDSSATSTVTNAKGITKPILIVANGGHYFLRPDEIVFTSIPNTTDKTFAIEEGAVHGGTECTQCEQALGLPVGTYGDTLNRTYDFMAAWLSARF